MIMTVFSYGTDARLEFCREILEEKEYPGLSRVILLPVPSTKDGTHIFGTDTAFSEICGSLMPRDLLVGYGLPKEIREAVSVIGGAVLDLSLDEDYIMENAHLTAIGTAARLLENGSVAPSDMKVGIIGYGRIGEKLTHILMFLGASVKVFTSKSELRRRLCMLGISAVDYNSEEEMTLAFADLDILINTAPARLISEESAKVLSEKRVIELASGENLPRCLTFERMASIPAVTFPKSAGKAIARSVDRALKTN